MEVVTKMEEVFEGSMAPSCEAEVLGMHYDTLIFIIAFSVSYIVFFVGRSVVFCDSHATGRTALSWARGERRSSCIFALAKFLRFDALNAAGLMALLPQACASSCLNGEVSSSCD